MGILTDASKARQRKPPSDAKAEFLKGPVPMSWLREAAKLGGKAVVVGLALWFRHGIEGSGPVKLTRKLLAGLHVSRTTARDCLRKLEAAGLVSVDRARGRCPRVTIIDKPP